jgi:selT/selW/selH-like putative selenoprotein
MKSRYGPYAKGLADVLTMVFKDKVKVVYQKDAGSTGNYEVTLKNNGEIIHSKKAGKGRCESSEEKQAVIDKIMSFLEKS